MLGKQSGTQKPMHKGTRCMSVLNRGPKPLAIGGVRFAVHVTRLTCQASVSVHTAVFDSHCVHISRLFLRCTELGEFGLSMHCFQMGCLIGCVCVAPEWSSFRHRFIRPKVLARVKDKKGVTKAR